MKLPDKQYADRLYFKYVKPLEKVHSGQYIAVSFDGKTIVGATLLEVVQQASRAFGKDNFVFQVGQKVIGKLR